MSQHDYVLENQTGAVFRSDLNSVLAAIVSQNSGQTEPTPVYPLQIWADTTLSLSDHIMIKQRNFANTSWVSIGELSAQDEALKPCIKQVLNKYGTLIAYYGDTGGHTLTGGLNAALSSVVTNDSADGLATSEFTALTDAGSLTISKKSVAGGGTSSLLSTGGGLTVGTSDANPINFKTNNVTGATLDSDGKFLVTKATGGLGYGAGAGSSVAQTVNKGTAIPAFNYPTGLITTMNTALAGNTAIAFTVANSRVAVTDTVTCNVVGGTGDVNAYLATAFPYAGGFYISLRNMTAGSLSDAVQIKFNLTEGSNT